MNSFTRFPLRQLVTDLTERFQLRFAQQAAVLLDGFSGVEASASTSGILLGAVAERDLEAAAALLQAAFPAVNCGPLEIVRLSQGTMEPYVRVRVTTPAENTRRILAQLNQRCAAIESVVAGGANNETITATAPLAQMLGFDNVLASTTKKRATIDYAFADFRPLRDGPPSPPTNPSARA